MLMRIVIITNMRENEERVQPGIIASASRDYRAPQARRISSGELLGEAGKLIIEHRNRSYRLGIARQGDLFLTA
jgi:hemin uptake protein HemP